MKTSLQKQYEKKRQKRWKDEEEKQKIERVYNGMIKHIRKGECKPDYFQEYENLDYSPDAYAKADLDENNKAFRILVQKKRELKQAQKEAEQRELQKENKKEFDKRGVASNKELEHRKQKEELGL